MEGGPAQTFATEFRLWHRSTQGVDQLPPAGEQVLHPAAWNRLPTATVSSSQSPSSPPRSSRGGDTVLAHQLEWPVPFLLDLARRCRRSGSASVWAGSRPPPAHDQLFAVRRSPSREAVYRTAVASISISRSGIARRVTSTAVWLGRTRGNSSPSTRV